MIRLKSNRSSQIVAVFLVAFFAGCSKQQVTGTAEELIQAGWNDFRLGEYRLAINRFEAVLAQPGLTDEHRYQATFGLANVWNLRQPMPDQDKERSTALYDQVIKDNPDGELAAWSMLAKARMKHLVPVGQDPDYVKVRSAYGHVIKASPSSLAGHEAFIYREATKVLSLEKGPTRQAVEALVGFVEAYPESKFLSLAYDLMSAGYRTLGQAEQQLMFAIKAFEHKEIDPTNPFQDNVFTYWKIATIAEFEAGAFDTARIFYRRIIDEYPNDIKKYSCKVALRRMDDLESKIRSEKRQGSSS